MQKQFGVLWGWILLLSFLLIHVSCSEKKVYRVLVIHSYEKAYAAYPDFNKMIVDGFDKRGAKVDVHTFYLDCEAYLDEAERAQISSLLDSVAFWKPDIILVNEDQATYSLLKSGNPLAKKIPIVFSGVNYPNWELIKEFPNVTGLHDKIDFKANIEMVQHFYGKKMRLAAILDRTYLDRHIKSDLKEQLKDEKIVLFQHKPWANERVQLSKEGYVFFDSIPSRESSKDMVVYNLTRFAYSRCLLQLKRDFTTANIGNLTYSPNFTVINEGFGYGEKLFGGYFTPLSVQVDEQVEAATLILKGAKPSDIPIRESQKKYVVDWDVLQIQGISKSRIPSYYEVINMPFRVRYQELWIITVIISVALCVFFLGVFVFLYRREHKRKRLVLADLADEKESLALAIEGSNTFAWKWKDEHFMFERGFWELVGISARPLLIEEFIVFIHPSQQESFEQIWKSRSEAGKQIIQLKLSFDQRRYEWWELRYTTIISEEFVRTSGLLLNIQNFKDREQELEEARRLAEKAELKQSFLANMSHEIRTPLNSIVGFSNILASDIELEEEDKQEYIETINRNSDLLLKLVNDILELSRMESGYMSFHCEDCMVLGLVDDVFATHQLLVPSRLEFRKAYGEARVMVHVDKDRLTQVLTNFLNNAVKFTENGSITVGYELAETQNEVYVYVEDTGKGIPLEEQQMIFGRFYKHDEFAQGTGLGLSICQTIAEKLGGRVELWSELGKGSRFTIVLPVVAIS